MKRLKSILGAAVLFIALAAIGLVLAAQSQAFAHVDQKTAPGTAKDSSGPLPSPKGTVVVRGSLNGHLQPAEEPWQNCLR